MNICNEINECLSIDEKYIPSDHSPMKGSEGPDGTIRDFTYTLSSGDAELSVYKSDSHSEVYSIHVGSDEIFDAVEADGAMSVESAKRYVERYRASRKFNPEKWLKSKYIDNLLKSIDSGKFKKPLENSNSGNIVQIILSRLIDEIENYGSYVDNGIAPFASDIVGKYLRTDKAKKIMFSKIQRLVIKGKGAFNSRFNKGAFEFSSDRSADAILDRAIDRMIGTDKSDWNNFFADFGIRKALMDKIKKVRK